MTAAGTVSDDTGMSGWFGAFTTQANLTPSDIQSTILGGGSITSTQTASFTISPVTAPEPGTVTMVLSGAGLVGLAMLMRRIGRARSASHS